MRKELHYALVNSSAERRHYKYEILLELLFKQNNKRNCFFPFNNQNQVEDFLISFLPRKIYYFVTSNAESLEATKLLPHLNVVMSNIILNKKFDFMFTLDFFFQKLFPSSSFK